MECSLVNIEKIPNDILQDAMENKTKVTVVGNLGSIHFTDGAINKAFSKAEAFDNIVEYLKEDYNFDQLMHFDSIEEIIKEIETV